MITDAHAWRELPDRGQHAFRCPYQELTESRDHRRDELARHHPDRVLAAVYLHIGP
jgi:hypothetical protein